MEQNAIRHNLTKAKVILIACIDKDYGIGYENDLLYDLPEDKAIFKNATIGSTVIMGRLTWESLPDKFRPLPLRTNFVISRDPNYKAPGAVVFTSIEDALKSVTTNEVYVMGGSSIYVRAMPYADKLLLSVVKNMIRKADRYFPSISSDEFRNTLIETITSKCGITFDVRSYSRIFQKETL
jgi:dihydrofolate reductase